MPQATETYRLFFALWPESELVAQIKKAVAAPLAGCDGKRLSTQHYHITLAFFGSADAGALDCLHQAASNIRGESFALTLEQLGYWPRPKIIWLAPSELPQPLIHLQADLCRALAENCGYQPEKRAYQPHITLMRKARRGPKAMNISPITWPVRQFALVRSVTHPEGAEYEVLKHWPLRDQPTEFRYESI